MRKIKTMVSKTTPQVEKEEKNQIAKIMDKIPTKKRKKAIITSK